MTYRTGRIFRSSLFFVVLLIGGTVVGYRASAVTNISDQVEMNTPSTFTNSAVSNLILSVASVGHRLVAVGERGHILLSDDNGASWRQVEAPVSATLTKVSFATPLQGWAVGQMGIVLHTSDGGETWTRQFDGVQAAANMLAAAQNDVKANGSNDATTAELTNAQLIKSGGPTIPFLTILPYSSQKLLIAGAFGMIFSSDNGGASWVSDAGLVPNPNGFHIYDLLPDRGSIYIIGEQGLLVSGSFGKPFVTLSPPFAGTFFGGLITAKSSLLLFGLQGTILRSEDQGKTWAQPASGVSVGIDCGIVLSDGKIVLGDLAGDLLVSDDDGKNFRIVPVGEPVASLLEAENGVLIVGGQFGLKTVPLSLLSSGA